MSQRIVWLIGLLLAIILMAAHHFQSTPLTQTLHLQNRCEVSGARFIKPGMTKLYSVKYNSSSQSDWSQLLQLEQKKVLSSGLAQRAHFHLEGDWQMSTLEEHGEIFIVNQLKSLSIDLTNNDMRDSNLNQKILTELSKPFVLRLDQRGVILQVKTQSEFTNLQKNLLRWLISESEIVFPEVSSEKFQTQWLAKEQDPNGVYEASYHIEEKKSEGPYTLIKTKRNYLNLASSPHKKFQRRDSLNLNMTIHPHVVTTAELDCENALVRHILTSGKTQSKIEQTEVGSAENKFELSLKFEFKNPEDIADVMASHQNTNPKLAFQLTASESREEMERLIHKTELGFLTAKDLLHLLDEAKSSQQSSEAIQALYLKFKALIYLHPETCTLLTETMRRENPRASRALQMIATALSSIGSLEAQKALISTLQIRSQEVPVAQILIPALGMTEHPTPAAEQILRDLIQNSSREEIVTTAGLSLGAMAGHLAEDAPERQKQIVDAVLRDLDHANTQEQKRFLISMLGNAGSPDAFSAISKSVDSQEPLEQAEAAMALRFIPGPEVDEKLLKVLAQPVDNSVKIAAAAALDYREVSDSSCKTLRNTFNNQTSTSVKRELIKDIFDCRFIDREVKEWLTGIQKNDPSEDVRQVAEEYARILTQSNI